ncbi:Uncharacterised protein [Streptococcus pneumoniae]|nr:Uncharacterised protein [Streptococcus pneumoniae]
MLVDKINHLAAKFYWRHLLKILFFAVKDTDTSRTSHLVTRKGEKVQIQVLDINLHMRCRLSTIHYHDCPNLVG